MILSRRTTMLGAVGLAALAAAPGDASAAPSASLLDDFWTRSGDDADPDAAPWAILLKKRRRSGPDGVARFDYRGTTENEVAALRDWLTEYQAVDPTALTRPAQMAFWINLYNAKTVDLVLAAYPVDSIREIHGGLFNTGPWDRKVMRVAGRDLSLDNVEHGILRPIWRDPRIHYAVNCASIGCPDLADRPFNSADLEAMLESAAGAYVTHPRGATVDDGELIVSSIYRWFEEDFGGTRSAVLDHLAPYAGSATATEIEARRQRRQGYDGHRYDWSLNDAQ